MEVGSRAHPCDGGFGGINQAVDNRNETGGNTGGYPLHNQAIHIGSTAVVALAAEDNVSGSADADRNLVGIPTGCRFGGDKVAVGDSEVAADESQLGGTLNLAVGAGENSNTFNSVAGACGITVDVEGKHVVGVREGHLGQHKLGARTCPHVGQLKHRSVVAPLRSGGGVNLEYRECGTTTCAVHNALVHPTGDIELGCGGIGIEILAPRELSDSNTSCAAADITHGREIAAATIGHDTECVGSIASEVIDSEECIGDTTLEDNSISICNRVHSVSGGRGSRGSI